LIAKKAGAYGLAFEGRSSFLKKRSKRLLSFGAYAGRATYDKWQKFFGSFFQKRTESSLKITTKPIRHSMSCTRPAYGRQPAPITRPPRLVMTTAFGAR
jgi:hypothetical protein